MTDFMTEVTAAEGRKQEAIRRAQQAFEQERAGTLAEWTEAVQQAQQAWDAIKGDADNPDLPEARARMEALRSSPPITRAHGTSSPLTCVPPTTLSMLP